MSAQRINNLILFIASAVGFSLIFILQTQYDLSATPDSVFYIESARNILDGNGYTIADVNEGLKVSTHWPPFFSVILAGFSFLTNQDPLKANNILQALLFALNIFLLNQIFLKAVSCRPWWLLPYNALLITSYAFTIHFYIWSESLFIALTYLVILLWLDPVNERSKTPGRFIVIGVILALAVLTRYAGLGIALGLGIYLLFNNRFKSIIKSIAWISIGFIPPVLAWIFYLIQYAVSSPREMLFHLVSERHLEKFWSMLGQWFAPSFQALGHTLFIFWLAAMLYLYLKNKIEPKIRFYLSVLIGYILFLFISISFFDFHTPLNNRLLAPVFPLALLSYFWLIHRFAMQNLLWRSVITGILAIQIFVGSMTYASVYNDRYERGFMYTGHRWKQSELIPMVNGRLKNRAIYTNGADAIRLLTGRVSDIRTLPKKTNPTKNQDSHDFQNELEVFEQEVISGGAVVIYFKYIGRKYLLSRKDLDKLLDEDRAELYSGGVLYDFSSK